MRTLQERFNEKFTRMPWSGCWIWEGAAHPSGAGNVLVKTGVYRNAPRVSWELHRGSIPTGMFVCHKCDVPACVNPEHLFLGTQSDNMRDCVKKGRHFAPGRDWTACSKGHPFDQTNVAYYSGRRYCKTCEREKRRTARAVERLLKGGPR